VGELLWDKNGEAVDYRILDANPAYEYFSGISQDKLVNLRMTDIVRDEGKTRLKRISEVIKTGKAIRFAEYNKYLHGWFEVYIFSMGRDNLFGKIFTNISERKQAEDAS
jgi:PAS domain S-box-containing protein